MICLSRTVALSACLVAGLAGGALAQGTAMPAGRDPATAPGGTEGIAGPRNEAEAIRSGEAVAVPPGRGGIPADDAPMPAPVMPMDAPPQAPARP